MERDGIAFVVDVANPSPAAIEALVADALDHTLVVEDERTPRSAAEDGHQQACRDQREHCARAHGQRPPEAEALAEAKHLGGQDEYDWKREQDTKHEEVPRTR